MIRGNKREHLNLINKIKVGESMDYFVNVIQKKNTKKQKFLVAASSIAFLLFFSASIAYALQVSEDQKDNILTVPTTQVVLDEQGFVSDPNGSTENMLASKKAKVTNTGETAVFVRALVIPTFQKTETANQERSDLLKESSILPVVIDKSAGINTIAINSQGTKWYLGSDGYYYYLAVLNKGESTDNLINGVTKPNNMTDFKGYQLNMDVKIEAIGAYSKRDGQKAFVDAWNGPKDLTVKSRLDGLAN